MDKQSVPGAANSSRGLTPDKLLGQKHLHKRLVATARSLKKQKRKLKTAEDSRRTKSYPKRKLLPEFDEEAVDPPQSKNKETTQSDR